ncbi:hypothetical protein [Methylobacterium planeticum]|uniref:Uncharacterized protein n=1 Tax=Methylobacterium planeticum TaxID=2615211 RepID=A0A6N6MEQ7_9HYPH|nr:hypothetical protein [Methylobacterium planeticum]KAB1069265.1 hypothetical protein F6X51_25665 [Methylobacterium planeticum]
MALKYYLVQGETKVEAGATLPVYDETYRAWQTDLGLISAGSIFDFAVESDGEPDPAPRRTVMTPIRFKAQWTVEERLAIADARAYTGDNAIQVENKRVLDILFGDLDDPRLTEVDVADPAVIGGIDFCAHLGILTAERAATIKLGLPA